MLLLLLATALRATAGSPSAVPTPLAVVKAGKAPASGQAASFTSLSQNPADGTVPYGASVVVTANLSEAAGTLEYVYLRYATDNFATCQFVPLSMTAVAGSGRTRFTATIPNLVLTAAPATVRYYAFTSSSLTLLSCAGTMLAQSSTYSFDYGVQFTSLSGPAQPTNCGHLIRAQLAATPALAENFYLRYSTNAGASFQTVAMTKDGATATAMVPAQTPGATVSYYAFSSPALTAAATEGASPAPVLRTSATYSFATPAALSISALAVENPACASGNDGALTFTVSGGTPAAYGFKLATEGGAFEDVTATNAAGDNRYRIGGLLAGRRYLVRATDGCGPAATAGPSAELVAANPAPTAKLTNDGPVCSGNATTVSIAFLTGKAPWSLTYTDGRGATIAKTGITTNPFIIETDALLTNRTYTLTELTDGNGCAAQTLPLATTVAVNALPTVTLLPVTTSVCAGTSARVEGQLTGTGPWTVTYAINGSSTQQTVNVPSVAGVGPFAFSFQTPILSGGDNQVTITGIASGGCLVVLPNVSVTISATPTTTWTGLWSDEWSDARNWTNCIPSRYLNARIPKLQTDLLGVPLFPYPRYTAVNGAAQAEAKNLTIDAGAMLTYAAGTFALYGNFDNQGTLQLTQTSEAGIITGATVSLNGSAASLADTPAPTVQTVSGLGEVYDLVVNTANGVMARLSDDVTVDRRLLAQSGVLSTGPARVLLAADLSSASQGTATISETDLSYVSGRVQTSRDVSVAGTTRTFGGLGLSLTPSGAVLPGLTTVTRYTSPATAPSIYGRAAVQRWFRVTPTVDAGLNVALSFQYFSHELNGLASASLLLHSAASTGSTSPTGPWTDYPTSVAAGPDNNGLGTVSLSGLSHLSDWALGERVSPLPVELSRFEARRAGPDAELSWTTASEQSCRGFEVQVSSDGAQFRALSFVPSPAGNSRSPRPYAYLDREATKAGARYYRLRQLDHDGTASFSPVRVVHFEQAAVASLPASLSAVPNPFGSSLTLHVQAPAAAAGVPLTITDVAGRLVRRQLVSWPAGLSQQALPGLAELPAGVYLLQVPLAGKTQHLRLVKE